VLRARHVDTAATSCSKGAATVPSRPIAQLTETAVGVQCQVGIAAAPMTYAIDGVQYVAVLAAPRCFFSIEDQVVPAVVSLRLNGKDTLPAFDVRADTAIRRRQRQ